MVITRSQTRILTSIQKSHVLAAIISYSTKDFLETPEIVNCLLTNKIVSENVSRLMPAVLQVRVIEYEKGKKTRVIENTIKHMIADLCIHQIWMTVDDKVEFIKVIYNYVLDNLEFMKSIEKFRKLWSVLSDKIKEYRAQGYLTEDRYDVLVIE